jgi:hypothetical protein
MVRGNMLLVKEMSGLARFQEGVGIFDLQVRKYIK